MFNPLYAYKQQKRNFQEDSPPYVPSLKRIRLWDENLESRTQQSHYNVDITNASSVRNESPNLRVIKKPDYFPAICVHVNNPFENNMDPTKFKYMPDLNAAQNPHYYEYNKLLFELYLERTRRCKLHNFSCSDVLLP